MRYVPDGRYYKVVNDTTGGTDFTNPTISTWYWSPTSCAGGVAPGNGKVIGGYYPNWTPAPPRLRRLQLHSTGGQRFAQQHLDLGIDAPEIRCSAALHGGPKGRVDP